MLRTKIVATLGPASSTREMIGALLDAGADVFRLNFSHGDQDGHDANIRLVREVSEERKRKVPIIGDLQGPKIRTSRLPSGRPMDLKPGESLRLTAAGEPSAGVVAIDYARLARHVEPGDRILLADGTIELRVTGLDGTDVVCEIITGGELGERKGVNVPGASLDLPSVTEKDKRDLRFALAREIDYIALSFVRRANDILEARHVIESEKGRAKLIAKIEKPQALEDLDAILGAADAVMVARGDLGVELSPWKVPVEQKRIIAEAAQRRKPVITATQMLESMMTSPSPTRAEASDVANAVLDGTDAVMLSGETAVGKYPVESVSMMSRIIESAEPLLLRQKVMLPEAGGSEGPVSDGVAESAVRISERLGACAIVVYTESGLTARLVSKHRPRCLVIGLSRHESVCRLMGLYWGIEAVQVESVQDLDQLVGVVDRRLPRMGRAKSGDLICLTAGTPFHVRGKTDLIKLHVVGEFDS